MIQYRYAPDTNAILILIQLSDTVQIRSKYGCHPDTHSDSDFRYSSDTLQTRMPFWYSFKLQPTDAVQIRSRRGRHSDTHSNSSSDTMQIRSRHRCHSDSTFKYSTDTLQTRMPFWYLIKASSRYSIDTLQTWTPFWYSFFQLTTYNSTNILGFHLQAHLQQDSITSPNGIFKIGRASCRERV